ncbi:aminopeptidase [Fusibacter ferrireducens]|uniref:Aminopeptidase n=1 Tax=Fusibacter ferrireducens TaxID=2785058 RepID=A0ABR9ZSU5_9FIRM|nr:aminopeptidase [Fusibacter ferrireducens]MBF4693031.1 aminopeptidase [Fusibacter ferrireducens]
MTINLLKKYAEVAIRVGVNLQPGQPLIINAPVTALEYVRALTEVAYRSGASIVKCEYHDELQNKMRYLYSDDEHLDYFPAWRAHYMEGYAQDGACVISVLAPNPDLLANVDPIKIARVNKSTAVGISKYREIFSKGGVSWLVIAVPSPEWAQKVFPELSEAAGIEALWQLIYKVNRIDTSDPVAAWESHVKTLQEKVDYLNQLKIKSLHYDAPGTNLTVALPDGYVFEGGGSVNTLNNAYYVPNLPTEEVFSAPNKLGVNGTLKATMPLSHNGVLIENFAFTFKDGKIVEFTADKGYETLEALLDTDEGARYLGEVALVPITSPIYQSGKIFYNTLFDENATCHFALGRAYPTTIKGGMDVSPQNLEKLGGNYSLIHVDFMVGSKALNITATTHEGEKIQIFKNGDWA